MELCLDDEEASCFFIFLQRLPAWLRVQLDGDNQDDIRRLATRADRLFALHGHKHGGSVAVLEGQEDEDEVAGPGGHQLGRRNAEEHAVHVRQLFTRLREHGLVINLEKCVFGAPSIQFLGRRLSAEGVEPLPENVSAVMEFPRPSMEKELQMFLGIMNFYRCFLPGAEDRSNFRIFGMASLFKQCPRRVRID